MTRLDALQYILEYAEDTESETIKRAIKIIEETWNDSLIEDEYWNEEVG